MGVDAARTSRAVEAFMNHDPRFALSQELEAKQFLVDHIRALAADDADFFTGLSTKSSEH
jgi:hypothetical protein